MGEIPGSLRNITLLDKLILHIIQFENVDFASMSFRSIYEKLKGYADLYPEVFGENQNPPSVSTISKRVKILKEEGVIKYPTTVLDCSKLGYQEMVLIYLKTNLKRPIVEIMEDLAKIPKLNAIYQISGDYCIFCLSKCADKMEQIEILELLKKVPGVENLKTAVVLQKAKEDMRVFIDI
ncbi:MAG: Lrp/AsnC family transcriptional regulator [Promethearchaeota archaeon]|nr:MAG: Lrp/AsnC family transcriptional regulator [Candidatus Lokiarchaeota archaeon]